MPDQLPLWDPEAAPAVPCPVTLPDLAQRPVILLDLNYTLVANSRDKARQRGLTYAQKVRRETYRAWLVELLKPYQVLLWTVRFAQFRDVTLDHLQQTVNWQPDAAFFNPTRQWRGALVKRAYLEHHVLPTWGAPPATSYLALESSAKARAMLRAHGIPAVPVPETGVWTRLPGHDLPPFEREQAEEHKK